MPSPEPKPCPKCGSRVIVIDSVPLHGIGGSGPTRDYFLFCHSCMAYGPRDYSIDRAIAAWNRRVKEGGQP
jgi:hypothetical protein